MSQAPETSIPDQGTKDYLQAFADLAQRIRDGASFSGRERHCAFLNTGQGDFADVSALSGFGMPSDGRGLALTDWDQDGDLDVWLSNRSAPRLQFLQNRIPSEKSHWISLRLQGTPQKKCPRDAVGSRVELIFADATQRRVKTLHAGNGLMSQSTKWLHFGLGSGERPLVAARVHWAGGAKEEFRGLTLGKRWLLVQGHGQAREIMEREPVVLPSMPIEMPQPTDVARIRLSQPLKIPELSYRDFLGKEQSITQLASGSAILINLWASWCTPCASELQAFEEARIEFESKGIRVVALNVDQLDPAEAITPRDAARAMKNFGFKGAGGMADDNILSLLQQSILASVYRHHQMPVPASFLIDRGGWLSAIYKGPVEVSLILSDLEELGKSPEAALAAAVPFKGAWAKTHFRADPVALAGAYIEGDYLEEARAVLLSFLEEYEAPPGNPGVPAARKRNMQIGAVYFNLGEVALREGKEAQARSAFETSLKYTPRQIPVLNSLSWLMATASDASVRNGAGALHYATFMMQAPGAPDDANLLSTLAAAQAAANQFPAAVQTTLKAIGILEAGGPSDKLERQRGHLDLYRRQKTLSSPLKQTP